MDPHVKDQLIEETKKLLESTSRRAHKYETYPGHLAYEGSLESFKCGECSNQIEDQNCDSLGHADTDTLMRNTKLGNLCQTVKHFETVKQSDHRDFSMEDPTNSSLYNPDNFYGKAPLSSELTYNDPLLHNIDDNQFFFSPENRTTLRQCLHSETKSNFVPQHFTQDQCKNIKDHERVLMERHQDVQRKIHGRQLCSITPPEKNTTYCEAFQKNIHSEFVTTKRPLDMSNSEKIAFRDSQIRGRVKSRTSKPLNDWDATILSPSFKNTDPKEENGNKYHCSIEKFPPISHSGMNSTSRDIYQNPKDSDDRDVNSEEILEKMAAPKKKHACSDDHEQIDDGVYTSSYKHSFTNPQFNEKTKKWDQCVPAGTKTYTMDPQQKFNKSQVFSYTTTGRETFMKRYDDPGIGGKPMIRTRLNKTLENPEYMQSLKRNTLPRMYLTTKEEAWRSALFQET